MISIDEAVSLVLQRAAEEFPEDSWGKPFCGAVYENDEYYNPRIGFKPRICGQPEYVVKKATGEVTAVSGNPLSPVSEWIDSLMKTSWKPAKKKAHV